MGRVCFTPAQLDWIADHIWLRLLRTLGFSAPLPAIRCRDGKGKVCGCFVRTSRE